MNNVDQFANFQFVLSFIEYVKVDKLSFSLKPITGKHLSDTMLLDRNSKCTQDCLSFRLLSFNICVLTPYITHGKLFFRLF